MTGGRLVRAASMLALVALGACGGSDDPPAQYAVTGTVTGLVGSGLVLQNNAGDVIAVAGTSFTFAGLKEGAAYDISVRTQPSMPVQDCAVANGRGLIGTADVSGVSVTCNTHTYLLGGTLTGLSGTGLVLSSTAGGTFSPSANGSFTFPQPVSSGSNFMVTVQTQPGGPTQNCTVQGGVGQISNSNVSTVAVSCATALFPVVANVTGLSGMGLTLSVGGAAVPVTTNGQTTLVAAQASGSNYRVIVSSQPTDLPRQHCTIQDASGTGVIVAAAVSVQVACVKVGRALFVADGSTALKGYAIDAATGALSALPGPSEVGSATDQLVVRGGHLYAASTTHSLLHVLSADPVSGTIVVTSTEAVGAPPTLMAVDPRGRFLYAATAAGTYGFAMDAGSGALAAIPGSPFDTGGSTSLSFSANGNYLFSIKRDAAMNNVDTFSVAASGALTKIATTAANPFQQADQLAPSAGTFLYYLGAGRLAGIGGFRINNATGALTLLPAFSAGSNAAMNSIVLSPGRSTVYAGGCSCLSTLDPYAFDMLAVNADSGVPAAVSGSPLTVGTGGLLPLVFDPSGRFAYSASQFSTTLLHGYQAGADGALAPVPGSPVAASALVKSLAVVP